MKKRPNAILIKCGDSEPYAVYLRVKKYSEGMRLATSEIDPGFIDEVLKDFRDAGFKRYHKAYCLPFPECCYLYQIAVEYCKSKGVMLDEQSVNLKTGGTEENIMMVEKHDVCDTDEQWVFG